MIEKLIKKLASCLDKAQIDYMIIGGQAVLFYGSPRLTRDIDITLGIDTDEFAKIRKICSQLGLKILTKDPEEFAEDTKVLPVEDVKSGIRVDFIFSFTPYEQQALKRTRKVKMEAYPVKFASCEDVIIHKMFAARAIDDEDVKGMLVKHKGRIDIKYIRKWLTEFSNLPGHDKIVAKFEALLR
jgi:predicted nucleotidyltransferase